MTSTFHPHTQPPISTMTDNRSTISAPSENSTLSHKYINSLSEKELQAYHIARTHLGSSFSLEKSKGFIEWKMRQQV